MRVHPPLLRVTHWLIAIAVLVMVGSGWRIYNNVPIFHWLTFPVWMTFGGDPQLSNKTSGDSGMANALLWHFAGMWLLAAGVLTYLVYGLASGRLRRKLLPIAPRAVLREVGEALRLRLRHDDLTRYNATQRLLYGGVVLALMLMIVSGLAIWKPVQLSWLTALFGDFQGARLVHFLCMSAIVLFVVVHVTLALSVPRSLRSIVTGKVPAPMAAENSAGAKPRA